MFAKTIHKARTMKGVSGFLMNVSIAAALGIALSGSGLFIQNVYGATVPVGTVTASSAFARSDASSTAGINFCVKNGEEVALLATKKDSSGMKWYKVSIGDSVGYVRSDLISDSKKTTEVNDSLVPSRSDAQASSTSEDKSKEDSSKKNESEKTENADSENADNAKIQEKKDNEAKSGTAGVVNASYVRVRSTASVESQMVKYLDKGDLVTVLGEGKAQDGHIWYQVKVGDQIGFIRSDYVNKTTESNDRSEDANADDEGNKSEADDSEIEKSEEDKATEANADTDKNSEEDNNTETEATQDASDNSDASNANEEKQSGAEAVIKGTAVRVRNLPVSGNVVCQLSNGHPIIVDGQEQAEDSNEWCKVRFSYMGNLKEGYVRSDFVNRINVEPEEIVGESDEEFENHIADFPSSYKNSLRLLHNAHPNWKFELVNTGLEWNDALTAESSVGKNLVAKNSVASWKSTATQAYNKANNTWYTFDGGSWVSASTELIAFYMDPRNFLNDSGIYQFENLDYKESQNVEGTARILEGTFMANDFVDTDGANGNYAQVFVNAGQSVGVSPYLLAGRAVQEQGINGLSQSIAGNVPGYEGFFNYYNVGAFAYGGRSATINGLGYAKGTDETNLRPWNTRAKSIYGGAVYIADNFVKKGQNTLYFQKFNVVNKENNIYSHQYMSNIQAASSESARLKLAYTGEEELTFRIPVYNNMPQVACSQPTSDSSPNAYLESISVDCGELTPGFSGAIEKYSVNAAPDKSNVTISAKAVSDKSSIVGEGTYELKQGENVFSLICKSQSGAVKKYTITVIKE